MRGFNAYRAIDLNAIVACLKATSAKFVSATIWHGTEGGIYYDRSRGQIVDLDQYEGGGLPN